MWWCSVHARTHTHTYSTYGCTRTIAFSPQQLLLFSMRFLWSWGGMILTLMNQGLPLECKTGFNPSSMSEPLPWAASDKTHKFRGCTPTRTHARTQAHWQTSSVHTLTRWRIPALKPLITLSILLFWDKFRASARSHTLERRPAPCQGRCHLHSGSLFFIYNYY